MYAVIEQGGKQYKVAQGDVVNIELTEVADDAKTIANRVDKALQGKWRVRSWVELNAPLFSALKLEKIVMFIFLSMAILLSLRITSKLAFVTPALLMASIAIPPVIAPSPITAICC